MTIPDTLLGDHSVEAFLREYWQKKPLVIRGALPDFASPLSPEELAGIACEEEATARLILEKGGAHPWELRYGPFTEEEFMGLPERHWTLLVQEVDRWVPDVAHILEFFRFIPNWRLDDVMVSYAPDGGTVGAHLDNYDVFLLQGLGEREWHIGTTPIEDEDLVPDIDVSILRGFEPDETYVLEPGDMLYLPPRLAHHGIAIGDCMTYSIGFRAPSHEDILSGFLGRVLEQIDPLERYSDPDLEPQDDPGRIRGDALERIREIIRSAMPDDEIDRWFGYYVTEPKRGELLVLPEEPWEVEELLEVLEAGARLERVVPTRFAYVEHDRGAVSLFAHGDEYILEPEFAFAAPLLTGTGELTQETMRVHLDKPDFPLLLVELVNDGHLEVVMPE